MGLGSANVKTAVCLSGNSAFITVRSLPVTQLVWPVVGSFVKVSLSRTLSYHHLKSSVVSSLPSDHLMPSRIVKVHCLASSLTFHASARSGRMLRSSLYQTRLTCWTLLGPK